jgi:hypothetical protein
LAAEKASALKTSGVEFIDENGSGPSVRRRKQVKQKK